MFNNTCNLFGDQAWDLWDPSDRVFRGQLAACLWELDGL